MHMFRNAWVQRMCKAKCLLHFACIGVQHRDKHKHDTCFTYKCLLLNSFEGSGNTWHDKCPHSTCTGIMALVCGTHKLNLRGGRLISWKVVAESSDAYGGNTDVFIKIATALAWNMMRVHAKNLEIPKLCCGFECQAWDGHSMLRFILAARTDAASSLFGKAGLTALCLGPPLVMSMPLQDACVASARRALQQSQCPNLGCPTTAVLCQGRPPSNRNRRQMCGSDAKHKTETP